MHLKRLILHGFKSFADRTVLDFEQGALTTIVGPNGCGKSNVFEAIKWTLGEQRPTSLRSKELTDVIFNGTVRRPPMGLCEATLVFDNVSRTLPRDQDEVEVTRRVFRTGDTEYLINGQISRLKDVRDTFAGTGLGAGGYAFMEQGKIDQILASNPLERRRVFEEAAGISRFRARKREAELKLNRVEDNLTRLHDIVEEINRQIRSLKIHAGKARSYRDMTSRVRDLQLEFSLHRYDEIKAEQQAMISRLDDLTNRRAESETLRADLREKMRSVEAELQAIIEGVTGFRTRYAEVKGRMETSKEKLEFQAGYGEEVAQRLQAKTEEISALRVSLSSLEEERILVVRERETLERDHDRAKNDVARLSDEVAGAREKGEELEAARTTAEGYLRDLEQRTSALNEQSARIEAEATHLEGRVESNQAARARVDTELVDLRGGLEERTGLQDEQTSELERQRTLLTEEERRAEELEQGFADAVESLRQKDGDLDRARSRIEMLDGLVARGEGLDEGTKALLAEQERDEGFLPGFRGLFMDLVEVDLFEARAVQAALGPAAEALVVDTRQDVVRGLKWLAENDLGGARFLPLDCLPPATGAEMSGVRPRDAEVAPVIDALLGGLLVVSKETFAERLAAGEAGPLLVGEDGAVWREGSVVTAPGSAHATQGLVVLRAEREDLKRREPGLATMREEAVEVLQKVRSDRDASRAKIKEVSVRLVNEEGEAARLDQEIMRIVKELDRLREESERLVEERVRAKKLLEEVRQSGEQIGDQKKALAEDAGRAATDLEAHRVCASEHAREVQRAASALQEVRIDATRIAERLESLAESEKHLLGSSEDTKRRLATDENDVLDLEKAKTQTARTIEEEVETRQRHEQDAEKVAESLAERENEADEVRERLRTAAEDLDGVEREIARVQDDLSSLRGREGELKASMESLLDRTRDEMDLDLDDPDVRAEAQAALAEAQADGQEPEEGTADAEVDEPEEEAIDWKAVEREIRELRNRIARLGNVNLAAVEELEEAEERAKFIFRERDDLLDGREQLRKVLKEIEVQSTDMFVTTFNSVAEHFSAIFRKLFGGGKAEMFLEDPETPLESGIEIKARPPGKEFRSITLLSGGERTMTAVALLFAIFRANPAPCAFLDEVDAALDEDNTERFTRMLDQFSDRSQFVIVTHSKRTMERADVIYGVTMPERGVSRRVAVRLEQMDDGGRIRDLAAIERQAAAEASAVQDRKSAANAPGEDEDAEILAEPAAAPRVLEVPAMVRRASAKPSKPKKPSKRSSQDGEHA